MPSRERAWLNAVLSPAAREANPAPAGLVREMFLGNDARKYALHCLALRDGYVRSDQRKIQCPTLLTVGDQGLVTPLTWQQQVAAGLASSRIRIIPNPALVLSRSVRLARQRPHISGPAFAAIGTANSCVRRSPMRCTSMLLAALVLVGVVQAAEPPKIPTVKQEQEQLTGFWAVKDLSQGGKPVATADVKSRRLIFTADKITFENGKDHHEGTFEVDPRQTPARIVIKPMTGPDQGKTLHGIYELKGDRLKICFTEQEEKRPKDFAPSPLSPAVLLVLERTLP